MSASPKTQTSPTEIWIGTWIGTGCGSLFATYAPYLLNRRSPQTGLNFFNNRVVKPALINKILMGMNAVLNVEANLRKISLSDSVVSILRSQLFTLA